MMRWWKSKLVLYGLCLELLVLSCFSFWHKAEAAADNSIDGFVVEANRVVGTGMTATIVNQESSSNDAKPMLRIQYQSATIYGMKLTKQFNSPKGPVTVVMKANGPVTVHGMVVDTTALSFKGACVKASETIPELGMEDVVMVAHFMDNNDSDLRNLSLQTLSGKTDVPRPGKLQILQDLSSLPGNMLKKEIEKISSGHMPLTCQDETKSGDNGGGIAVLDPVLGPLDPVLSPLDPVLNPLDPVLDPLNPVLKPIEPVLKPLEPVLKPVEPVLKPLEPVLKPVEPVLKPLEPVLKPVEPVLKPVEPILKPIEPVTQPLEPIVGSGTAVIQTTCEKLKAANGVITKELGLDLVNEAISKKVDLSSVCQSDPTSTSELKSWKTSLLNSLGLFNILGQLIITDPMQQLYKMKDKISAEKDGAIIYKP